MAKFIKIKDDEMINVEHIVLMVEKNSMTLMNHILEYV